MQLIKRFHFIVIILTITSLLIIGCDDDPTSASDTDAPDDEPSIEFTAEESAQIVYDYLVEMGFIPSEGSQSNKVPLQNAETEINKWIEIEETDDGWKLRVYFHNVREIIPTNEWYDRNSDFCSLQYRLNKTFDTFVELVIVNSSKVVTQNVVDAETDQVIKSNELEMSKGDPEAFKKLVEEAYEGYAMEEFVTACGLFEGPVKIHFVSEVEAEMITSEMSAFMNSGVKSEIHLKYSEEDEQYVGQADLAHYLYENTLITEFGCSVNLTDAVIRVELDVEDFVNVADLNLYITDPISGDHAPSASLSCGEGFGNMEAVSTIWFPVFVIFHQDHVDKKREAFRFTEWEESGDSDIIGQLEFENTADFTDFDESFSGSESMPVTEHTRIEIRPNP